MKTLNKCYFVLRTKDFPRNESYNLVHDALCSKKLKEYQCNIAPQNYYLSVKPALNTHENCNVNRTSNFYHKLKDSHT